METQSLLRRKPLEDGGAREVEDEEAFNQSFILNELPVTSVERSVPVSVSWSPYGENLAFATSDNFLSLWNVAAGTLETLALDDGIVIREIVFLADSHLIVATSELGKLIVIDIDDGVMFETTNDGCEWRTKMGNLSIDTHSESGAPIVYRPGRGAEFTQWELIL
jgi:WD40 repeat protein